MAAAERLSMSARLVWKALTVRRARVAVAVAAIMVGAAMVSALANLYFDISVKMSEELRTFGANFFVGPAADRAERGLDAATLAAVRAAVPADRLAGASPFLYGVVRLDRGNAVLAGVDFDGLRRISPYWQVEGHWIGVDFDERHAMVGRRLARSMELKVGDAVTIVNRERGFSAGVRIKGIMETGEAEDEQIFVTWPLAQKALGTPDRADFALLSIKAEGAGADALAERITAAAPGIEARPIRKIAQSDGRILDRIDGLMALVAATIVVITTLCVNTTLTAMVVERTREIGLKMALGAAPATIIGQFLAETAVIGLVGVALGLGLGFAVAQVLGQAVFHAWVSFRPAVVPVTLCISLAAALAAAVIPIRAAVRVVPAQVLRGD